MSVEKKILQDVDNILGPDGLVNSTLNKDGHALAHNRAQHEYARLAAMAFCRQDDEGLRAALTILQAATGTGKSIGYLVPLMAYAARSGERVAVSTFTRGLQAQLVEDAAIVSDWVGQVSKVKLRVARRLGRQNYVSASSLANMIDRYDPDKDNEDLCFLEGLLDWVEEENKQGVRVNSGILEDYLIASGLDCCPAGMSVTGFALDYSDGDEDSIAYLRDIEQSRDADILIVNHSLAIMNSFRWGRLLDGSRKIAAMVFDEADRLPAAAESAINADLVLHKAMAICEYISAETKTRSYADAMTAVMETVSLLHEGHGNNMLPITQNMPHMSALRAQLKSLLNAISRRAGKYAKSARPSEHERVFCDLAGSVKRLIQSLDQSDAVGVISWSPVRAYPSIRLGHSYPGRLLSRMWHVVNWDEDDPLTPPSSYLKSALFTSATLGVPGRPMPEAFADFMRDIGIWHRPAMEGKSGHFVQTDLFRSFEPTAFGSMKFVLADPRVSNPIPRGAMLEAGAAELSEDWLRYAADMIRCAQDQGGRTLVLVTSFKEGEALQDLLSDVDNLQLHKRGTALASAIATFRKNKGGILITPSGWEGVDLPGVLAHVLITRLPNMRPDTISLMLYRMSLSKSGLSDDKVNGLVMGRLYAETRRKMAQGIGRGIRKSSDRVTVWIADPRFPLPEAISSSLDPIVLEAKSRPERIALAACIPMRFRKRAYPSAKIFVQKMGLYSPQIL